MKRSKHQFRICELFSFSGIRQTHPDGFNVCLFRYLISLFNIWLCFYLGDLTISGKKCKKTTKSLLWRRIQDLGNQFALVTLTKLKNPAELNKGHTT